MLATKRRLRVNFKDFWHADSVEEIRKNHLYVFLSRRFELELAEDPDILFYSFCGTRFLKYKCLRIFYTGENYRPDLEVSDYAISFDYLDDPRHYRLPFYVLSPGIAGLASRRRPDEILRSKTKFCNFIYSNSRCKVRNEFYHKLSEYKRVDSAGKFLNNTGVSLRDTHAETMAAAIPYGGWSDQPKIQFQRACKFSIAFENSSRPGYTTEKLVDAMLAETVPIYWGDPAVARDLNPGSFINCHDYGSLAEVVEVVKRVDADDELYKSYLAQPLLTEHGRICSLNEDRFFDWFDRAVAKPPRTLVSDRDPIGLKAIRYTLKHQHWTSRKFGPLSHIWSLYKRV